MPAQINLAQENSPSTPPAGKIAIFTDNSTAGVLKIKCHDGTTITVGGTSASGSTWRSGSGVPDNGVGANGDFYVNTANGYVYTKTSGTYYFVMCILGTNGTNGTNGSTWRNGSGPPVDATGVDGDYYLYTSNGNIYCRSSGTYSQVANIKGTTGDAGANGSTWRSGTGAPSDGTGVDGDFYLKTTDGNVYRRSSGAYSLVANTVGPAGAAGAAWRTDTGAPNDAVGVDGDMYLRTTTGAIYRRSSGTYTSVGSFMGPTGPTGSVWRNGSGVPDNATGVDGDMYLRTNGDVYTRTSGTYSVTANIAGATGSVWRNGAGAPSDSLGIDNDYYLDTTAGNVYKRSSGTYSIVVNIKGPAGNNGSNGSTWRDWTYTPDDSLGIDGDYYIYRNTCDVYHKQSGHYNLAFNIKGTAGTVWRSGSGAPDNGTGVDGNLYLRTSNGDVYTRQYGSYTVTSNISGQTVLVGHSVDVDVVNQSPTASANWSGSNANGLITGTILGTMYEDYGDAYSDGTVNAYRNYDVSVPAGTYSIELVFIAQDSSGIFSISLGGGTVVTIDGYQANADVWPNARAIATGMVTAVVGSQTLHIEMATKNASSSSYVGAIQHIRLIRTA